VVINELTPFLLIHQRLPGGLPVIELPSGHQYVVVRTTIAKITRSARVHRSPYAAEAFRQSGA